MTNRSIYRLYAQKVHGKIAKEFVEVIPQWYQQDTLVTKDNNGKLEECTIDYRNMLHFVLKEFKLEAKKI